MKPASHCCHVSARWTYSPFRALLRLDGKPWAVVTPGFGKALTPDNAEVLLAALNGPVSTFTISCATSRKRKKHK